ncbi:unnamed protein product [Protopolystoma xenopodis]|uniref:Uncharacterized protein n=1 Tax=Protopolystoma xenopodis TaxID=117903 RepID=A0A448XFS1_9PLAT|nr:unnamed protein product [Protopolystoma xenopodis]
MRRRSRGLRRSEVLLKAKRLPFNAIQPSSSGEIGLRISSASYTFIRNESPPICQSVLMMSAYPVTHEGLVRFHQNEGAATGTVSARMFSSRRMSQRFRGRRICSSRHGDEGGLNDLSAHSVVVLLK